MPLFVQAQLKACRNCIKDGYDFWLYEPEGTDSATKKPVVMFLHGKTLSGSDLSMVKRYGCIDALKRGRKIDAIVVAPQTQGAWNPQKVMDVYDWVRGHCSVDTNRFYVIGMSMGGYGTLDVVAAYPDKIAAAMAMCGGATAKSLCGLNEVPLWIVHGTADSAVPIGCSQRVVDAMKECGDTTRLIFSSLKGVNHTRLARVFYLEQTYEWLFSHSLTDSTRSLNRDFSISDKILAKAYKDYDKDFVVKEVPFKTSDDAQPDQKYYDVKKGDTLSEIAVNQCTTVSILCKLNNMKRTDKLKVGRKIRVK